MALNGINNFQTIFNKSSEKSTIFNKSSEKVPTKNHNMALNGIWTLNALCGFEVQSTTMQLSTNATNPTPLVLSI